MTRREGMVIAIDMDNTFTADPACWAEVIRVIERHGHTVIVATARHKGLSYDGEELTRKELSEFGLVLPMVFGPTEHRQGAKRQNAREQGWPEVHIWIEDRPEVV